MSKKTEGGRTFHVSVIGLSGLDHEKNLYGVGKSCLCNRFVRPLADEYILEHSSVYSSSDFAGRVINNDHYLYWGSVVKQSDDGSDQTFQLVEQTEFIEDSTLTTLTRGGQISPYVKRCAAVKLQSQEKLMYISRDQVALQSEYEQVQLPGGKFTVDGFVCVYDVSSRGKADDQEMLYASLLSVLQKTKKPVVVAATKCDDLLKNSLDNCHKLFTSKKLTNVPIIECSAQENVNVDLVFSLLAQLIEKGRIRSRITPYSESKQIQKEKITDALGQYQKLVEEQINNFQSIWKNTKKKFESRSEYLAVRDLCGIDTCKKIFNKHIRRLKKEAEDIKLAEYLTKVPEALNDIFPTIKSIDGLQQDSSKWRKAIKEHLLFDKWFMELSNGNSWQDSENLTVKTSLVPFDVLGCEEVESCFIKHVEKLKEAEVFARMKKEFQRLLQLTPQIQPGTPWDDAVLLLKNEESYKYLSDDDKLGIFLKYQEEIREQGRIDLQELLFESAKLFANFGPSCRPTTEKLHQICNELQKDERYRRLDKLSNERDTMLWNHIALIHSPTRCLGPEGKCMDRLIQDVVATTDQRPLSSFLSGSCDTFDSEDSLVTLVLVGADDLAKEFANGVEKRCYGEHMEYPFENKLYELDMKIVEDNDEKVADVFGELDDISMTGLCCVFSSQDSFNYVESYLEKTMGQSDDILREDVPIVLVFAHDTQKAHAQKELRSRAQDLVKRYNCEFIDIHISHFYRDQLITDTQVDLAIKHILECIRNQTTSRCISDDIKDPDPDLRILLCANCGDPYPVELILGPLFTNQSCSKYPNRNDSVILETFVGTEKKKVMITFTSYHRAYSLNMQKYHGYILVYSAVRAASLSTLSVYAASIPTIPIQVLATTGSYSGASVVFHSNVAKTLLADGTNLASRLYAKFQTTSAHFQFQAGAFTPFFNRVWEKREESEETYLDHIAVFSDALQRKKHDPLPDVPPSPYNAQLHRNRSYSEHINPSATLIFRDIHNLSKSLGRTQTSPYEQVSLPHDGEVSPYAVVKRRSFTEGFNVHHPPFTSTPNASSTEEVQPYASTTPLRAEINASSTEEVQPYASTTSLRAEINASSTEEVQPYASTTSLRAEINASSTEDVQPYASTTPLRAKINAPQPHQSVDNVEHLYSKVDRSAILKAVKDETRGASPERPLNPPYEDIRKYQRNENCDTPPPVPLRTIHDMDDLNEMENRDDNEPYSSIQTSMSNNLDEGYSTVDDTKQRANKLPNGDPYEMDTKRKIRFFTERITPPVPEDSRRFPSDSLRRLHDKKSVPSLIRQFSNSAPLAQMEESEVPDYATIEEINRKMNRHSAIPEITTNHSDNVVMRNINKESQRSARSADENTIAELMGNAGNIAAQRRLECRRMSPGKRLPLPEIPSDITSPVSEQSSPLANIPHPPGSYSVCSDDGQTADDEATIDRSKKLRIPSIRRSRKNSPMTVRRVQDVGKRSRNRKRKEADSKISEPTISRSRSVPRNFNPLTKRYETGVWIAATNQAKYNSISMGYKGVSSRLDDAESVTEEDTEDDTLTRKRKKDEKEAERNRKREEKKQKKREKLQKKKQERIRKKEEEFRRKKSKGNTSRYFGHPLSEICPENSFVPLFVTKCIKFVEDNGMQTKGIYRVSGNKADVEAVHQRFEEDQSKDFTELGFSVHAVTGALKSFFTKLPGALIPSDSYDGIIQATTMMDANERFSELRKIMKELPPQNYSVFKRLMFHLNKITELKDINMMESRNLAIVFWPTLAPPVVASIDNFSRTMNMCLFVQTYIEHCTELFKDE